MNFETIDWEAEAIRVARAFGVASECLFVENSGSMWLCPPIKDPLSEYETLYGRASQVVTVDGLNLEVVVDRADFSIELSSGESSALRFTHLTIRFDGTVVDLGPVNKDYASQMAKGLYHLNLLTPEVEATLKVSISAHEKLEWALEYERRFG